MPHLPISLSIEVTMPLIWNQSISIMLKWLMELPSTWMLSSCALHSINVCGKTTSVELIVKLHKVVHMPNAIACLIFMSKLLFLGYKVNEDHNRDQPYWQRQPKFGLAQILRMNMAPIIYGIRSIPIIRSNYITSVSNVVDDTMHQRFWHLSKEIPWCV